MKLIQRSSATWSCAHSANTRGSSAGRSDPFDRFSRERVSGACRSRKEEVPMSFIYPRIVAMIWDKSCLPEEKIGMVHGGGGSILSDVINQPWQMALDQVPDGLLVYGVIAVNQTIAETYDSALPETARTPPRLCHAAARRLLPKSQTAARPLSVSVDPRDIRKARALEEVLDSSTRLKDVKQELASCVGHRFFCAMPPRPFGSRDCEWKRSGYQVHAPAKKSFEPLSQVHISVKHPTVRELAKRDKKIEITACRSKLT